MRSFACTRQASQPFSNSSFAFSQSASSMISFKGTLLYLTDADPERFVSENIRRVWSILPIDRDAPVVRKEEEKEGSGIDKIAFQSLVLANNQIMLSNCDEEEDMLRGKGTIIDKEKTKSDVGMQKTRKELARWKDIVSAAPRWFGFSSAKDTELVFSKSILELSTEMCITQKGYFLTEGRDGNHNQLCPKANTPVTFLSAPGLDFNATLPTIREAGKYFVRDPKAHDKKDKENGLPNARDKLQH
eukprot:gene56751-biopygen87365